MIFEQLTSLKACMWSPKAVRHVPRGKRCFIKSLNINIPVKIFQNKLAMSTILETESYNLLQSPKKVITEGDVDPLSA